MQNQEIVFDYRTGNYYFINAEGIKELQEMFSQFCSRVEEPISDIGFIVDSPKYFKKKFKQNKVHRRGKY